MSYVLIAVLICFSAFFSGSEIAYTSLNKLRVKKEAEQGNKLSKMVVYICDHYQNILSTILIGNNLVNIAATSVAAVIALQVADRFGMDDGTAATVVTLIMTILILIFGEISPKVISARKNEAISKFAAYPLLILMVVFYPLVFLSTGITKALSFIWRRHDEEEDVTITEEEFATILETEGQSKVTETIFENRFKHAKDLGRMGANISIQGQTAYITGVKKLSGAKVSAKDLRGGAALVIAGLAAEGETVIENVCHIDRGYDKFEIVLSQLGAKIVRKQM